MYVVMHIVKLEQLFFVTLEPNSMITEVLNFQSEN